MQGWIKLHRKLMENPIWDDANYLKLWMYCLFKASHKEHEILVGNQMVKLGVGQFVIGRKALADDMNRRVKPDQKLSEKTWGRYLKNLEKWQMLTIKVTNKFSIITIDKYRFYQHEEDEPDHVVDQQLTNNCPTSDQQLTTNKNVKNVKKEKKIDESEDLDSGVVTHSPNQMLEERFIQLRNSGLFLSAEDYQAIDQVIQVGVPLEKALEWLNECFARYKPKYSGDNISSFKYCRKYILDQFHRSKRSEPPPKTPDIDPFLLKMQKIEEEAKKSRGETPCPS